MQIVQICIQNVMSAPGGEAVQHRGAVQGITIQALGDSRASTGTVGLCHFKQTHSADVPRQVQRDPEDGSGPLQGQVNHQQIWQLNVSGFTCQPLGFGRTEQHKPVLMIRFEPFVKNPRLYPVLHLVSLDRRLASSDRSLRLIFGSHPNVYSRQSHLLR